MGRTGKTVGEQAAANGARRQHQSAANLWGTGWVPQTYCHTVDPPLPSSFPPREQRLVKELVAGSTRLRRRLDYIISNLSHRSAEDLEPGVRQVGGAGRGLRSR